MILPVQKEKAVGAAILFSMQGFPEGPNSTFVCVRGVTDPNSDTKRPFSADSDAGVRLLDLHWQQKTTNLLLLISTEGWGEIRLNAKTSKWRSRKNPLGTWWWKENPASNTYQVSSSLFCAALKRVTGPLNPSLSDGQVWDKRCKVSV